MPMGQLPDEPAIVCLLFLYRPMGKAVSALSRIHLCQRAVHRGVIRGGGGDGGVVAASALPAGYKRTRC